MTKTETLGLVARRFLKFYKGKNKNKLAKQRQNSYNRRRNIEYMERSGVIFI